MSAQLVREIPLATQLELAKLLDPPGRFNWRNLIQKMPQRQRRSYTALDVAVFELAVHKPNGSSAYQLLKDMGMKGVSVEKLVRYLLALEHEAALLLLISEQVIRKEPVKITTQPTTCTTEAGKEAQLVCLAAGLPFPKFQWYKGKQAIKGAVDSTLYIERATQADAAQYCCLVKNSVSHEFSDWAEIIVQVEQSTLPILKVIRQPECDRQDYVAVVGKVALVIGNQRYHGGLESLVHTEADTAELASLLTSIDGFKVVSLTNLTSVEMKAAINYFISLLGEGIFGVFYFAGHGFEHNGENYLLPIDAGLNPDSSDVCIRAQDVLRRMQERQAKLSLLILDVCRTQYDRQLIDLIQNYAGTNNPGWHSETPIAPVDGNYVLAYACLPMGQSFERRSRDHGIYMTHLRKHICKDIGVLDVLMETQKSIRQSEPPDVQRAGYFSSLVDEMRLHERVNCQNERERVAFTRRACAWDQAHTEPSSIEIYRKDGLSVRLYFGAEFSNVLIASIQHSTENPLIRQLGFNLEITPGGWDVYGLELECINEKPKAKEAVIDLIGEHLKCLAASCHVCYRIRNLQRLPSRTSLTIHVSISYVIGTRVVTERINHDCGWPLFARIFPLAVSDTLQW